MYALTRETSEFDYRPIVIADNLAFGEARELGNRIVNDPNFPRRVIVNSVHIETGDVGDFWVKNSEGKVMFFPLPVQQELQEV